MVSSTKLVTYFLSQVGPQGVKEEWYHIQVVCIDSGVKLGAHISRQDSCFNALGAKPCMALIYPSMSLVQSTHVISQIIQKPWPKSLKISSYRWTCQTPAEQLADQLPAGQLAHPTARGRHRVSGHGSQVHPGSGGMVRGLRQDQSNVQRDQPHRVLRRDLRNAVWGEDHSAAGDVIDRISKSCRWRHWCEQRSNSWICFVHYQTLLDVYSALGSFLSFVRGKRFW